MVLKPYTTPMASLQLLPPFLSLPHHNLTTSIAFHPPNSLKNSPRFELQSSFNFFKSRKRNLPCPRASINGESNGAVESKKPTRRGRKKGSKTSSTSSSSSSPKKQTRRSRKSQAESNDLISDEPAKQQTRQEDKQDSLDSELEDYDDGIDFPYEDPPLVCCFGAVKKEFVPTVRVSDNPMHPDIYSQWKMLQWDPPEFVRAPGGPPSNVAISHVRLGGRAAFMGKVGDDDFGDELVLMMNQEKVQTRAVKFDESKKTACSYMKIRFEDGKMRTEMVREAAEDSLLSSELNLAVLKEVIRANGILVRKYSLKFP